MLAEMTLKVTQGHRQDHSTAEISIPVGGLQKTRI